MSKKCKYYRRSENFTYIPECTGDSNDVHPESLDGDFCEFCGRKIKFKENTEVPTHLTEDY